MSHIVLMSTGVGIDDIRPCVSVHIFKSLKKAREFCDENRDPKSPKFKVWVNCDIVQEGEELEIHSSNQWDNISTAVE